MPLQNGGPPSNRYSAISACWHCDRVLHELWCITQNAHVQYAYQVVGDPAQMRCETPLHLARFGRKMDDKENATGDAAELHSRSSH